MRTPSCGIQGSHHPPHRDKPSQPKCASLPTLLPAPHSTLGACCKPPVTFLRHLDKPETFLKQLPGLCSPSPILLSADRVQETNEQVVAKQLPGARLGLISPCQGAADTPVFVCHAIEACQEERKRRWRGEQPVQHNQLPKHPACCPPHTQGPALPRGKPTEPLSNVLWCSLGCCSPSRESSAPRYFSFIPLLFPLFLGV